MSFKGPVGGLLVVGGEVLILEASTVVFRADIIDISASMVTSGLLAFSALHKHILPILLLSHIFDLFKHDRINHGSFLVRAFLKKNLLFFKFSLT